MSRRWLEADLQVEMLEVDFVKVKVSWEIAQFSPAGLTIIGLPVVT